MASAAMNIDVSRDFRCIACGGEQWSFLRQGHDLCRPEYHKKFRLMKCSECGLVAQCPTPDANELRMAYSAEYAPYRPAWKEPGLAFWKVLRAWTTRRRIARLKRYGKGKKLLEVGAGSGDFLLGASKQGWDVKGVEYNADLARSIREELGFDVRPGELTGDLWDGQQFDAVVYWSVLEHLLDPLQGLLTAASYLRPDGALFFQIPTRRGVELGKWFDGYWALLDLPRHLNFLDEDSLRILCDKAGLELILFKTPFLEMVWCYAASSVNYASQYRNRFQRVPAILALLGTVGLLSPWLAVQAWSGLGTEAFALAVKR